MDDLMGIIKKRRSVRAYQDKPLPKEVVEKILEAARYAPSARNEQPLEYKVITNKTLIKKLSDGISEAMKKEVIVETGQIQAWHYQRQNQ